MSTRIYIATRRVIHMTLDGVLFLSFRSILIDDIVEDKREIWTEGSSSLVYTNRGSYIPSRIFNMVVDGGLRHWVSVVAATGGIVSRYRWAHMGHSTDGGILLCQLLNPKINIRNKDAVRVQHTYRAI